MQKQIVGQNEAGQRLSKVLEKYLSEAPKNFIYKMLRKKNITLNGKKADGTEKTKSGLLMIQLPSLQSRWYLNAQRHCQR